MEHELFLDHDILAYFDFQSLLDLVVTLCTTRFNIRQYYILPTQCMYVFCMNVRTHSDYFPAQHEMISFYQPHTEYLLFGKSGFLNIIPIKYSL